MPSRDMFGNPLSKPVPEQSGKSQSQPASGNGSGNGSDVVVNETIIKTMAGMVNNVLHYRRGVFDKLFDKRRNIDDECGFPDPEATVITGHEYQLFYDRDAIANTVVSKLPKECWKVQPRIVEDPKAGEEGTEFEKAVKELPKKLRGQKSYLKSDKSNPLWYACRKVDILSRIGQFGIMVLGFDDSKKLNQEATPREGMALTFIRCFQENLVQIVEVDGDMNSPRFGQPTRYNVMFHDPRTTNDSAITSSPRGTIGQEVSSLVTTHEVHWTRVIHVADNTESSEVCGVPSQKPVWNNLLSLKKLYGGSAEMYWKGAFPGLSVTSHPQLASELGNEVIFDKEAARNEIEQYMNGLQRYLALIGMDVQSLSPQVVDPTPQINVQLEAISAQTGTPKRRLMGLEGGPMSDQEDDNWNEIVAARQNEHVTPFIVAPLLDRLIYLKVLPTPKEYEVRWPDLSSTTSQEKSRVAFQRTQALAMYKRGMVEEDMAPIDFYTRVIGLDEMEAQVVIENAEIHRKEMLKYMAEKQKTMIELGLVADPTLVDPTQEGSKQGKGKMSPKADVAGSNTNKNPQVEIMATRSESQSKPG